MKLCRFLSVIHSVNMVSMGGVCVVSSLLVMACRMVFGGFLVMPCGVLVVLCCFTVMFCALFAHICLVLIVGIPASPKDI